METAPSRSRGTKARGSAAPGGGRHDDGCEHVGKHIRIGPDRGQRAVAFALQRPDEVPQAACRTHHQQQRHRKKRHAGQHVIDNEAGQGAARCDAARSAACAHVSSAKPVRLEREQPNGVDAKNEQVAKEQAEHERRRNRKPQRAAAFTQRDPGCQRPQHQTDAEHEIHRADQEHVVIEQRKRDQRQRRPAAEQRAVQRERARDDQGEAQQRVGFSRQIDIHHPLEQRDDHVHHQVRNDLPVDLVVAVQKRIAVARRDDVHPRQVIDVVGDRRQRIEQDRHRGDRQQQREKQGDLALAEARGTPAAARNGKSRVRRREFGAKPGECVRTSMATVARTNASRPRGRD